MAPSSNTLKKYFTQILLGLNDRSKWPKIASPFQSQNPLILIKGRLNHLRARLSDEYVVYLHDRIGNVLALVGPVLGKDDRIRSGAGHRGPRVVGLQGQILHCCILIIIIIIKTLSLQQI